MGGLINIYKKHSILVLLLFELILIIALFLFGFRITYNPELITDWEAVEACGTWFCGFLVPIAVVYLQKSLDESDKRTGDSNAMILKMLTNYKNISGQSVSDLDNVYSYICVKIFPTTEEICEGTKLDMENVRKVLLDLEAKERIWRIRGYGGKGDDVAGCKWKKR